jgi:ATP-binding cassette subfamily B (MDR/TAP) protein 1
MGIVFAKLISLLSAPLWYLELEYGESYL